jgi:hypothetical protein
MAWLQKPITSRAKPWASPFYFPQGTSKSMPIVIDPPSPLQDHMQASSSQGLSSLGKCESVSEVKQTSLMMADPASPSRMEVILK